MTPRSIWAVLGVAPDADRTAVRRAYATRLKVTSPEDDAEAFQELRAAYEQALRQVAWREQAYAEAVEAAEGGEDAAAEAGVERDRPGGAAADDERAEAGVLGDEPVVVEAPAPLEPADPVEAPPAKRVSSTEAPTPADGGPDPIQADIAVLKAAMQRFAALVEAGEPPQPVLQAAVDEILSADAMNVLGVRGDVENWLAQCLYQNYPRGDGAIAAAAAAFGWAENRRRWDASPLLSILLERQEDQRHLDQLRSPKSSHHKAYLALRSPITPVMRKYGVYKKRLVEVRRLIRRIQHYQPTLLNYFDPDDLQWWNDGARSWPNLPPWAKWSLGAVVTLAVFALLWNLPAAPPTGWEKLQQLRAAAEAAPDDAAAWIELCVAVSEAESIGEESLAVRDCERAVSLDPQSLRGLHAQGLLALRVSNPGVARTAFDAALALSPNDARALYGRALSRAPEDSGGLQDLRLALSIDPNAYKRFDAVGLSLFRNVTLDSVPSREDEAPPVLAAPGAATRAGFTPPQTQGDPSLALQVPKRAWAAGRSGRVVLQCVAGADGALRDCIVWSERPQGYDFGDAALAAARSLRVRPGMANGKPVDGVPIEIPLSFVIPNGVPPPASNRESAVAALPNAPRRPSNMAYVPSEFIGDPPQGGPSLRLRRGERGVVRLGCEVTAEGRLEDCEVLSESRPGAGLTAAGLFDARRQVLRPAMRGGVPVSTYVEFSYTYSFRDVPASPLAPAPQGPPEPRPAASAPSVQPDPGLLPEINVPPDLPMVGRPDPQAVDPAHGAPATPE